MWDFAAFWITLVSRAAEQRTVAVPALMITLARKVISIPTYLLAASLVDMGGQKPICECVKFAEFSQ